ncbi:hypothetical protein PHLGIDRAFT_14993 [Phlebiopsis gigantea 11061_1 CR5-6]|uniref:BHLH domain-containing protein n=1 Tax=Phlebiopsis gigantea (strain 11061_1 CR5-6) TaxID=745531 RepID=A0A0C3RUM2_PHLG1|nr:hypothetical protein PHLGIDRAFT_14993 [Phlebiopsis gigantea 11061_1 CR5-6]
MNANISASAHNQKDFFDSFLAHIDDPHSPASVGQPSISDLVHTNIRVAGYLSNAVDMQQQPMQNVGMDVLEGLMAMQDNRGAQSNNLPAPGQPAPQLLMEQQMRLNQLQQLYQLQTQIFQQQIELLSGQTNFMPLVMDRSREQQQQQQQYLPTPAASAELAPQPSPEFVPQMLLQNDGNVGPSQNGHPNNQQSFLSHNLVSSAPHSAPANIVFQNIHSPYSIPHGGDLEFDEMSPLTSPWLGASYTSQSSSDGPGSSRGMQQAQPPRPGPSSAGTKRRTASPGSDDHNASGRPSRKRQAARGNHYGAPPPSGLPSIPSMGRTRGAGLRGGTRSASSTPLFPPVGGPMTPGLMPARGGRRATSNDVPGDTPSPVDLSMPPPAAPVEYGTGAGEHSLAPAPMPQQNITPVTPASIMNLGRLSTDSSLAPSGVDAGHQVSRQTTKASGRPRSATTAGKKNSPNGSNNMLISPALKPLRPAGTPLGTSPLSPTAGGTQPPLQVRKTSHKAAEQKRRDSLKTSFDDLRLLLPPIPLPSDEGFPDEPILPGAMPPRGPPKGNADGPNRGVSKLQLLRCGNDYLRRLKGRVERRDTEIERLRREIARLRIAAGAGVVPEGEEAVDLEEDLDAVEAELGPLGRSAALLDDEQGDDDGGEM